jgi:hypothetical protein
MQAARASAPATDATKCSDLGVIGAMVSTSLLGMPAQQELGPAQRELP